jgi:hypothetical protein
VQRPAFFVVGAEQQHTLREAHDVERSKAFGEVPRAPGWRLPTALTGTRTQPGETPRGELAPDLLVAPRVRVPLVSLLLIVGCTSQAPDQPPVGSHVETYEFPGMTPPKLDLLFVVDDTAAMTPYLARTQAMLRETAAVWPDRMWYGLPDFHVAVATESGQLGVAQSVHGDFIDDEHVPDLSLRRVTNYDGDLGDAVAALGTVGTGGTVNQPFAAMKAAIESTPGFLRNDALLAIVIVSATDDASTAAPADVAAWAKGLKLDPNMVVVIGAFPANAPRLTELVAQFPNRSASVAIDASDYTPAVDLLRQTYVTDLVATCIDEPMDVDPVTPGPQYDCTVELVSETGVTEVEPPCPGPRCWTFHPSADCSWGGLVEVLPFMGQSRPGIKLQCVVAN